MANSSFEIFSSCFSFEKEEDIEKARLIEINLPLVSIRFYLMHK